MDFITLLNKDKQRIIEDVVMHPYKINQDESGILVETLRRDWNDIFDNEHKFFMQYYSETPSGIARDENLWHYHPTVQDDRFSVLKGEVVVAIADNRYESPTRNLLNLFYINARENPYLLLVPKKTLHGFMVVSKEPAILINYPTALYNEKEEERIPYADVNIKMEDGQVFNWNLVRQNFNLSVVNG